MIRRKGWVRVTRMHRSLLGAAVVALISSTMAAGCSFWARGTTSPTMLETHATSGAGMYTVVDTAQQRCFDSAGAVIAAPAKGSPLFGQDAQHAGNRPSYVDNGDGTVQDNVTGLMWTQTPDLDGNGTINAADKLTYDQAVASASKVTIGGYHDWRLPTIKELYSLIDFAGTSPGENEVGTSGLTPFIDTRYFKFGYGDVSAGDRIIDAQFATSTRYVATTMQNAPTMFGVNFADGRIKGYPIQPTPRQPNGKGFYVLYVRGNVAYGKNSFVDNHDGTVTDEATRLMWSQADSGEGMDWPSALAWVVGKNAQSYCGHDDWRLPNAKELQSLVDYTRAPAATGSAAIDPVFASTKIKNEAGQDDYPWYWTSTTHIAAVRNDPGFEAVYLAFGRAMGTMGGRWIDVHGAGAQRSDPKTGDPRRFPRGRGPQGDAVRIDNYVRLVRDAY
jgi:Protein of unknown function (DUF1566)